MHGGKINKVLFNLNGSFSEDLMQNVRRALGPSWANSCLSLGKNNILKILSNRKIRAAPLLPKGLLDGPPNGLGPSGTLFYRQVYKQAVRQSRLCTPWLLTKTMSKQTSTWRI